MEKTAIVTIGVNLVVVEGGKILLGKRKNIVGDGMWGLPGGRLDEGEWITDAAGRELLEETGLVADELKLINVVHQLQKGKEHWVQFGFEVSKYHGELENREPEVCERWEWFDKNDMPENIFPAHIKQIEGWMNFKQFLTEERLRL